MPATKVESQRAPGSSGRPRARKPHKRTERELRRLRLAVCDDTGFRLYLATYDQPKRRDELIARVVRESEAEKVRVTRLDLAEAGPETNLVGLLRAHLQTTELPPGWRQAVMVTGIEQRLDYASGREGFAFLHQANLLRDALPEAAPVPVVLWLSRMASAALPAEAPDLWHWRAANFDFTGDEAPRLEILRELTMLRPEDEGGLSREQRRARIRMLEDLLAELERYGPPKSKRQGAERTNLLHQLGTTLIDVGRGREAVPIFERQLSLAQDAADRPGEMAALTNMGDACYRLGEPERAIEYHEKALEIAHQIGERGAEATTLNALGNVFRMLGDNQRANEFYNWALEIAREIGDRRNEGAALNGLGTSLYGLGEIRRSIEYYEQAIRLAGEIGERRGESITYRNLGRSWAGLRDFMRAIEYYEKALRIAREIGNRQTEAAALSGLGSAYFALGEPRRAVETFQKELATAREIGYRPGEGEALDNSALAFDQLGERGEAIRLMEEALRVYEQIGHPAQDRARAQLEQWQHEDISGELRRSSGGKTGHE